MQKPLVIEAVVIPQLYSIRRPLSYQIADAFPLPQPSSLIGALTCCLAKIGLLRAKGVGEDYIRELIEQVLDGIITVTIKPLSAITVNPIILRRLRVLEKGLDEISKDIEEGKLPSDAMVREYTYGRFAIYFVFSDRVLAEASLKALYLLERIGDTESLVSVESVNSCKVEPTGNEGEVDTLTKADMIQEIYGDFTVVRQCTEEFSLEVKRVGRVGFKEKVKQYLEDLSRKYTHAVYLPLKVGIINNKIVYMPSRFKVKTTEGFRLLRVRGLIEASLVTGAIL